jgi:hypothetical protein
MFIEDTRDESLLLHGGNAIGDLVLIRHEQRPAALQRDADLNRREPSRPCQDDPPDRTCHAAPFEHEVGNGRDAAFIPLFTHDVLQVTWRKL